MFANFFLLLSAILFLNTDNYVYAKEACPDRIISLGPSITEQLYILGLGDKIIGVTTYCIKPPQAGQKEKIGTVTEINLEKVVSLRPDLVLAISLTDPRIIKKLKDLNIEVETFPSPKTFSQLCEGFLRLAKLVGEENKAKDIIGTAKGKVDFIKNKYKLFKKTKVFVQLGAKPLFAATGDYFVNDFIEFAGGANVARDLKSGLCSREEVIRANPDYIIIATMGIVGEQEKRIWQNYRTIEAVKNNRIYIVDSYKLCSFTPVSFVEGLEEIERILYFEETGG